MAIGRTFKQAFAKALRSRELDARPASPADDEELLALAPGPGRRALRPRARGAAPRRSIEELHARTSIDPWFLHELAELVADRDAPFAGERTFKSVDTCAAEFAARTPYYYSALGAPRRRRRPPTRSSAGSGRAW